MWHPALAVRLNGHENSVDLLKCLGIIAAQEPALIRGIVDVHHAQVKRTITIGTVHSPRLESAGALQTWLLVKIVPVENQKFPFG